MNCKHEAEKLKPILEAEVFVRDGRTIYEMLKFKCTECGAILKIVGPNLLMVVDK